MNEKFRLKLFVVLMVFSFLVTTGTTTVNYFMLKKEVIQNNTFQLDQAIYAVKNTLKSLDKAYYLMDQGNNDRMEHYMMYLQDTYANNDDFETWDFEKLAKEIGNDIYIIDEKKVIIHTNVHDDLGMDFTICCKKFNAFLNERRAASTIYIDGLDIEQNTGNMKKYSYMATPDKKYIIELGFNLEGEALFQEYNFLVVIDELVREIPVLEEISVINYAGLIYGNQDGELSIERKKLFDKARQSKEVVEVKGEINHKPAIIRYVPILSEYDNTNSKLKVLEIVYNKDSLRELLKQNQLLFMIQLLLIFIVTAILSMFISRGFSRPMYLAFHDSLTGLKNRASLDRDLDKQLKEGHQATALFMLDIDNFKFINDTFGHGKGDEVLKCVATIMNDVVGKQCESYRMGGDEFVIMMPESSLTSAKSLAEDIINRFTLANSQKQCPNGRPISVSIGIALSEEEIGPKILLRRADIALYRSKEKGKNQYQIYDGV